MLRPTRLRTPRPYPSGPAVIPPGSRVHALLAKRPDPEPDHDFVPLMHPDLYFYYLEQLGEDTTRTRQLHARNPAPPPIPIPPKVRYPVPEYVDHVPVTLEVSKSGRVRCRIHTKMLDMYEKMQKTHKMPSIEDRIMAAKDFGYPDEVLKDMLVKHEKKEASRAELDEFVTSIFGEMSDKKSTAPKKKNLHQVFKIRKMVYAMPDQDPDPEEEEPNEDFNVDAE